MLSYFHAFVRLGDASLSTYSGLSAIGQQVEDAPIECRHYLAVTVIMRRPVLPVFLAGGQGRDGVD